MKKYLSTFLVLSFLALNAQQTANRFFYELTFKPKKEKPETEKVMTSLDITKDKSIYQDFTVPAQDSIIKMEIEAMEKSGTWKDMSKSIKMPKFSFKIYKTYPDMTVSYMDRISTKLFKYDDPVTFNWKILPDKEKIGAYNTQKATTEFGGRKWTAWFSTELPFQDGPYKFHGLPGLIVKVEDDGKNYSWTLQGNKNVENWEEFSFAEKANTKYGMSNTAVATTKEKFTKSYENFKADPLAEARPYMTPEFLNRTMPGSSKTFGEMMKEQEKLLKDFFGSNNNPIEIPDTKKKK
ncbi:GLPGLI family protein [Chryseobacterium lacus]|uniref:GLPGLI family protein n=1 Tax=Chryseobacterium lacus TaxID=2058346 RepID=A0A368N1G7_9FLAO|nr:GLPGLI family protein [Chryseobacterium lacus]RCU43454.1 GLPGLI family protein [Chryseobacterium lacus]RST28467.1 GLPGLI family protein [Chryseobacterium lacus]